MTGPVPDGQPGCEFVRFADKPGVCDACGKTLTKRQSRWCSGQCSNDAYNNHRWTDARPAARKRDGNRCVREGCTSHLDYAGPALEVNHIEPRNGAGYDWGCWNHLSNLETLCHGHHLEVTRQQAKDRVAEGRRLHRERFPESYSDSGQLELSIGGTA